MRKSIDHDSMANRRSTTPVNERNLTLSVTKNRNRDISVQPNGGYFEGKHFTNLSRVSDMKAQRPFVSSFKKKVKLDDENSFETTI